MYAYTDKPAPPALCLGTPVPRETLHCLFEQFSDLCSWQLHHKPEGYLWRSGRLLFKSSRVAHT